MTDVRALIRDVLQACRVHPPRGLVWFGRRIRIEQAGNPDPEGGRAGFILALASHLYDRFYCQGGAVPLGPRPAISGTGEVRAFMTALAGARRDHDRWDAGWTLVEPADGSRIVRKWDLDFSVGDDACRMPGGAPLHAGAAVEVRVPSERWCEYPGYMLFEGRRIPRPRPGTNGAVLTRLYLNLDDEGARRMIDLCGALDDAGIPLALKVAARPEGYDRCDTVILFIEREDYGRASEILVAAGQPLRGKLRPRTPAFARPLAPGVGAAEDPGNGGSFGESRCRLLAEGIVIAAERAESSLESRLRIVEERFGQEGITLDRAHLDPESADYEIGPWNRWSELEP